MPMLVALAAVCALAAASAQADSKTAPTAQTLAPTDVTSTSALLHGSVYAGRQKTTYWFDIGPTKAYGAHTQPDEVNKSTPVAVQSSVSGLTKGSVYHVRLVAINDDGLSLGADMTFTAAAPVAPPAAVAPAPAPASGTPPAVPPPVGGSPPALAPPAAPVLGQSVGVAAPTGNVYVRLPGSTRNVALTDAASIPVGSILDARKGTVALSSALPGDDTQTGTFHGGLFQVRQPAGARGMTELVLRGPLPTCTRGGARAAAASAKRRRRALWGSDDHGRFRTRGSNSVATVRGTAWYVEDRCDGTLTRVGKGSVSVRDLRRERTVIVDAGESYLARSAR